MYRGCFPGVFWVGMGELRSPLHFTAEGLSLPRKKYCGVSETQDSAN